MNDTNNMEDLRFPIGKFSKPDSFTAKAISSWIDDIESFPTRLSETVQPLSLEQWQWKYRPNGWTIHQVVHHCADSHMNSLIRFKLALTEDHPTIKPYIESKWAELPDTLELDPSISLTILNGVHKRLTRTLRTMNESELLRTYFHPEDNLDYTLREAIALYAWHGNHHLAHIQQAIDSKGIFN